MAHLPKELLKELIDLLRRDGVKEVREVEGVGFRVLSLGDLQITLEPRPLGGMKFLGLIFSVLDEDFIIEEDGRVSLVEPPSTEGKEPQGYFIEDQAFLDDLANHLRWRIEMVEKYS